MSDARLVTTPPNPRHRATFPMFELTPRRQDTENSFPFLGVLAPLREIVLLLALLASTTVASAEPVKIIFDTDITTDVDDVLALATIHALADRGECELLVVTTSMQHANHGAFIDAVNTFYGRPDVPIAETKRAEARDSKYLKLSDERDGDGFRYPRTVASNDELPDPVTLLRQTLVAQPDNSVVLVSVGLAGNVAALLKSQPDDISSRDGVSLVAEKMHHLSVMAGAFDEIPNKPRHIEWNVKMDIPSMRHVADKWPDSVPIIWSGYEIGLAAKYPPESIRNDFGYTDHHIIQQAYLLYLGPNKARPTWDLTSVLHAVRPDGYFGLSPRGRVTIGEDGYSTFEASVNGRDQYLTMTADQRVRVTEALRCLVSQPPRN